MCWWYLDDSTDIIRLFLNRYQFMKTPLSPFLFQKSLETQEGSSDLECKKECCWRQHQPKLVCCQFLLLVTGGWGGGGWFWFPPSQGWVKCLCEEGQCDKYSWLRQRSELRGNNTEVMFPPAEWKHTVTISLMRLNVPSVSKLRGISINETENQQVSSPSRNLIL